MIENISQKGTISFLTFCPCCFFDFFFVLCLCLKELSSVVTSTGPWGVDSLCLGKSHNVPAAASGRCMIHIWTGSCVFPTAFVGADKKVLECGSGKEIACPWTEDQSGKSLLARLKGKDVHPRLQRRVRSCVKEVAPQEPQKAGGGGNGGIRLWISSASLKEPLYGKCYRGVASCLNFIGYNFHIWDGVERQSIHPSPAKVSWQRQQFTKYLFGHISTVMNCYILCNTWVSSPPNLNLEPERKISKGKEEEKPKWDERELNI